MEILAEYAILDHGYCRLVEAWGSDERVIESARMSTNKGFEGWGPIHGANCTATNPDVENACTCGSTKPGDEKLLRYLWEHNHLTPFEMGGLTLEIQAPILVFREWHRHRTQSVNEMSARYIQMPDLHYVPSVERIMAGWQSKANKQGSTQAPITEDFARQLQADIRNMQIRAYEQYEYLLSLGMARELARVNTPVSRYSRMRVSANLRNWLGFLALRMDGAAQWEIRQYAEAVGRIVASRFPRTWELFQEGRP